MTGNEFFATIFGGMAIGFLVAKAVDAGVISKMKNALLEAESFIAEELGVFESSYLPFPTLGERTDIQKAQSALKAVRTALWGPQ